MRMSASRGEPGNSNGARSPRHHVEVNRMFSRCCAWVGFVLLAATICRADEKPNQTIKQGGKEPPPPPAPRTFAPLKPKLTFKQDGKDLVVSMSQTINNSAHALWTNTIVLPDGQVHLR